MSKSETSKGEGKRRECDAGGAGGWEPSGSCLQLVLGNPTPNCCFSFWDVDRGIQKTTGDKRHCRLQRHTSHRHTDPEGHRRRLLQKQGNPGSSPSLYGRHSDRDARVLVISGFVDGSPGRPDSHKPGPLFLQGWTAVPASFRCGHEKS